MSEYQYYEFRAVDRPLTTEEMASLRAISSRASITAASFVNTYNYGDFRGDPEALVRDYFDAFVYLANWGTRLLTLRLPEKALERSEYAAFCTESSLESRTGRGHLVFSFEAREIESDWEDGEGWMDSLLPLRDDLLRGDLRALHLGWLLAVQEEAIDDEELEPPVPPGLGSLSPPLTSLVEFLDLDQSLLDAAAETSLELKASSPSKDLLTRWIADLPESEKDESLLRVAIGESRNAGAE